jgi:hypothetical protein
MLFRKLLILGVIGGLLLGGGFTVNAFADSTPVPTPEAPGVTYKTYLPIMLSSGLNPPNPTAILPSFGAELINSIQSSLISPLAAAGSSWTRHTVLEWAAIEPIRTNPPTYLWNKVNNGKETQLATASANGVNVIATVKYTPSWAQKYPGVTCGPVHPNNLDEFAQFMAAAVARYSVPPYNIKYWELGNEPDMDAHNIPLPDVFGCWGDSTNPATYGGDYYADMLKVVYPAIKAADPNATVIIGGLLLDCDPTHPPQNLTCDIANFFEGILKNGGANYFDYVAFHAYAYYEPIPSVSQPRVLDELNPKWAHRGGVVVGKLDFLRTVMANYGINKPVIMDEGGLICNDKWYPALCTSPSAQFYEDQADYLVKLFARDVSLGVVSTIWFTLEGPGWYYGGLFYDTNSTPKPAYKAMTFMNHELSGASYVSTINQYSGVWGYEFLSATKRIWILGVNGSSGVTVPLPAGWQHVYDKYGATVNPNGNQVLVKSPLYIELIP